MCSSDLHTESGGNRPPTDDRPIIRPEPVRLNELGFHLAQRVKRMLVHWQKTDGPNWLILVHQPLTVSAVQNGSGAKFKTNAH